MADDDHDDGDLDLSMLQADDGDEENAAPAEGEDAGELDFDEAFMAAFQGEGAEAMEGEGLQDQDLMYDSQALDQEEGGLPDVGDEEPAATQGWVEASTALARHAWVFLPWSTAHACMHAQAPVMLHVCSLASWYLYSRYIAAHHSHRRFIAAAHHVR